MPAPENPRRDAAVLRHFLVPRTTYQACADALGMPMSTLYTVVTRLEAEGLLRAPAGASSVELTPCGRHFAEVWAPGGFMYQDIPAALRSYSHSRLLEALEWQARTDECRFCDQVGYQTRAGGDYPCSRCLDALAFTVGESGAA